MSARRTALCAGRFRPWTARYVANCWAPAVPLRKAPDQADCCDSVAKLPMPRRPPNTTTRLKMTTIPLSPTTQPTGMST